MTSSRKRNLQATLSMLLALSATAVASAAPAPRSSDDCELLLYSSPVTTIAARAPRPLSDSPSAVTVITEEEIARSAALSVPDLLRNVPGVDVAESNRSLQNVTVRGFNDIYSSRLLVLVDGRPLFQDTFGTMMWNQTPLLKSRIKRIEVMRGPGSALYGAAAFNGVVNIVTKTPEELAADAHKVTVSALAGEQGTQRTETLVGESVGKGWSYALGGAYDRTSGMGERRVGDVRDSLTSPMVSADVQKRDKRGMWLLSFGSAGSTMDLASVMTITDASWRSRFGSLAYTEDRARNPLQLRMVYSTLTAKGDASPITTGPNALLADARTSDIEVQQQRALGPRHRLVYGASYRDVSAIIFMSGPERHTQTMWSAFAQDEYRASERTSVFAGLRLDTHSDYGSHISPRLSVVRRAGSGQQVRLAYGSAFRYPALLDAHYSFQVPFAPGISQTVDASGSLREEQIESLELGYRRTTDQGYLDVALYRGRASSVIGWQTSQFLPPPFGLPLRVDRANVYNASVTGLELDIRHRLARGVTGLLNYSYQNIEDEHGEQLDLTPRHKLNLGALFGGQTGLFGSCVAHFVGGTTWSYFGLPYSVPSYMQLDARLGWTLPGALSGWSVSVAGTNLLNDGHREFPALRPGVSDNAGAAHPRTVWLSLSGKL